MISKNLYYYTFLLPLLSACNLKPIHNDIRSSTTCASETEIISFAKELNLFGTDDYAFCTLQESDNNYVVSGTTDNQALLFKLNEQGIYTGVNKIWGNVDGFTYARYVTEDKKGNIITSGSDALEMNGLLNRQLSLTKFNSVLSFVEGPIYYGENGVSDLGEKVAELDDGKFIQIGYFFRGDIGYMRIVKANQDLSFRDSLVIPESRAYDIIPAHDAGSFIIVGATVNNGTSKGFDYLGLKIDENLNLDNSFRFDAGLNNEEDIMVGAIGHPNQQEYLFVGHANSPIGDGFSNGNAYLTKVSSNGRFLDDLLMDSRAISQFEEVVVADDGNYVVVGRIENDRGEEDIWLIKIGKGQDGGTLGDIIWERRIDSGKRDFPRGLLKTNDGGYFISGFTNDLTTSETDRQILVIKTDANGCICGLGEEFVVEERGQSCN